MDPGFLEQARRQATLYKVLSNEKRVMILWLLSEREMTVSEIALGIETTLQNASQHLRLMKDRGVLESRRDGQTIYYQLTAAALSHGRELKRESGLDRR